ncbi:uncharacterized protein P884DRAFT_218939 [Thermothelomyces heterothallicus CBS 202.75]|uniref:uncharacterized protein n=1 Tax=Thermothelomyces heterothallicus CBS 202.75 TaxID=1149848 RepID=UPI00374314A8
MSFKKFKADVSTAGQKAASGEIPGVRSITTGDSDGEVVIKYHHESLLADVRIQALAQDLSEYPDGNMFMLWTDDPDPPTPVAAAVKAAREYLLGMSVYEMVTELVRRLEKEIGRALDGEVGSPGDVTEEEEVDDYDVAFDTDYPSDGDEFGLPSLPAQRSHHNLNSSVNQKKDLLRRIRRDLREVREAGYRVGFFDGFGKDSTTGIIALSIRLDKLALSNEAMEAWDVKPTEYVVLLVRFDRQYYPLEQVFNQAAARTEVAFRIGKCSKHKPSIEQASRAFAKPNRSVSTERSEPVKTTERDSDETRFEKLLVSNSLDSFMCESFISLLKIREAHGCSWEKANDVLLSRIGLVAEESWGYNPHSDADSNNTASEPEPVRVPGADHLLQRGNDSKRSFPLIAVQFAVRYFVRCTEYCLRCHRRLEKGFEALRPYVCSDPLCLFQYMAMGLGPSIEHEILTEPYVVDLLVSLCYAAIQPASLHLANNPPNRRPKFPIRSFPVGLRLRVPDLTNPTAATFKERFETGDKHIVFEDEAAKSLGGRLAPGVWLAFRNPTTRVIRHARVKEVYSSPKTAVIEVISESAVSWFFSQYNPQYLPNQPGPSRATGSMTPTAATDDADMVDIYLYDTDFDSLDDFSKAAAMRHLLDTLPPILEIEEWLASHPEHSFRAMGRISPAAASLLQWIVSSNRSCILQVDRSRAIARRAKGPIERGKPAPGAKKKNTGPPESAGVAGRGRNREHERILGMDGWVQFRFAQGAPDKELRFNRALQEVAARKHIGNNPTIFAWHGSNLANWHSILRTGLDFQDINSGRAYGHGVYFSRWQETSMGYASKGQSWPNSDLGITYCLSLNEIINAPNEFVSSNPHYVVSQLDWQQCRYLFVQTAAGRKQELAQNQAANGGTTTSPAFYPQARGREAFGQGYQPLKIPLCAIPLRTTGPAPATPPDSAKRTMHLLEESEDEDAEDASRLVSDDEDDDFYIPPSKKPASPASSVGAASIQNISVRGGPPSPASSSVCRGLTEFEPGALGLSTLPHLQPPSFATDAATRALSRELRDLQALQAKTPLHELGWYIDFDYVSNLYQWIIELHSFDISLPLAQDMKLAQVTSVVLELRFGSDFPFSPPFVRVVRPRFLPFMEGGGGHVTAGGAMCMELLTESGWSPANSMESVLLQVRMALCNLEPRPARLDPGLLRKTGARPGYKGDYSIGEAIEAFTRAAKSHGWTVPKGLKVTALGV